MMITGMSTRGTTAIKRRVTATLDMITTTMGTTVAGRKPPHRTVTSRATGTTTTGWTRMSG